MQGAPRARPIAEIRWTQGQEPHTLGILCNPRHPAFRQFPTDFHSNWQWWYLLKNATAIVLDTLPAEVRPIVQVIDDRFRNRRLGLIFEVRIGAGRLIVSGINLVEEANPVARQLWNSVLAYAAGPASLPLPVLAPDQLEELIARNFTP